VFKMKLIKKLWIKYQVRRYEKFLLKEGIKEAKNRNKNIQIGLESKLVINDDCFQRIYLPENERGQTDIAPILALGAENHPEEARKYLDYRKKLENLD
jgi:hypothetical protein